MARARGWWPIAAIVLALVLVNVGTNRLVPRGAYVPFSLAIAGALVWFARAVDGRSTEELGLARAAIPSGVRWGGVPSLAICGVLALGFVLPFTHDLFLDDRVRDQPLRWVLGAALVRVPLGTVVLEEIAFRSVLPGMLAARTRRWTAYGVSSALFGLWHVLPALGLETVNPVATDTVGDAPGGLVVVAAVVSTAIVGLVFSWLRDRSDSVVAPMLLHWTANGAGYLFAYAAWRWG